MKAERDRITKEIEQLQRDVAALMLEAFDPKDPTWSINAECSRAHDALRVAVHALNRIDLDG